MSSAASSMSNVPWCRSNAAPPGGRTPEPRQRAGQPGEVPAEVLAAHALLGVDQRVRAERRRAPRRAARRPRRASFTTAGTPLWYSISARTPVGATICATSSRTMPSAFSLASRSSTRTVPRSQPVVGIAFGGAPGVGRAPHQRHPGARVDPPRQQAGQFGDQQPQRVDEIAGEVRTGRVPARTGQVHVHLVARRGDRPDAHADLAGGQPRVAVQRVDLARPRRARPTRARRTRRPGRSPRPAGTAAGSRPASGRRGESIRRAAQHRDVRVVPAAVAQPRRPSSGTARPSRPGSAARRCRRAARPAAGRPDPRRTPRPSRSRSTEGSSPADCEHGHDHAGRAVLAVGEFGLRVQIAAQRDDVEVCHGASLSSTQAPPSRRNRSRSCSRSGRPCQNSTESGANRYPPQCGGRGHRAVPEPLGDLRERALQLRPRRDDLRLRRRPRAELRAARPGREVRLGLLARHARHRAGEPHRALERLPEELRRRVPARVQVVRLRGRVVGEERDAALVDPLGQDGADGRAPRVVDGRHLKRVRLDARRTRRRPRRTRSAAG